jgi:hypothetical protein
VRPFPTRHAKRTVSQSPGVKHGAWSMYCIIRTKYAVERISEETMLDLAEMGQVTSNPRKEMVNKMEEPVKHQQQIKYKVGKIGGEMGPDLAEAGQVYKPAKDMEEKPVSYLTKAGKKARMRVQNEDTTTRIALVK